MAVPVRYNLIRGWCDHFLIELVVLPVVLLGDAAALLGGFAFPFACGGLFVPHLVDRIGNARGNQALISNLKAFEVFSAIVEDLAPRFIAQFGRRHRWWAVDLGM
jgi:hypothetical protein